jgi:hypothetical protein
MAAKNSVIRVEPELAEAFNKAPRQQQERVKSAMRNVLRLVPDARPKVSHFSKKESELLLKISQGLTLPQRERLQHLTDKMEYKSISVAEHKELLRLTDKMEQLWNRQLQAVIELARIRKITPNALLRQLGMTPGKHVR